jgi:hypothetical protein
MQIQIRMGPAGLTGMESELVRYYLGYLAQMESQIKEAAATAEYASMSEARPSQGKDNTGIAAPSKGKSNLASPPGKLVVKNESTSGATKTAKSNDRSTKPAKVVNQKVNNPASGSRSAETARPLGAGEAPPRKTKARHEKQHGKRNSRMENVDMSNMVDGVDDIFDAEKAEYDRLPKKLYTVDSLDAVNQTIGHFTSYKPPKVQCPYCAHYSTLRCYHSILTDQSIAASILKKPPTTVAALNKANAFLSTCNFTNVNYCQTCGKVDTTLCGCSIKKPEPVSAEPLTKFKTPTYLFFFGGKEFDFNSSHNYGDFANLEDIPDSLVIQPLFNYLRVHMHISYKDRAMALAHAHKLYLKYNELHSLDVSSQSPREINQHLLTVSRAVDQATNQVLFGARRDVSKWGFLLVLSLVCVMLSYLLPTTVGFISSIIVEFLVAITMCLVRNIWTALAIILLNSARVLVGNLRK